MRKMKWYSCDSIIPNIDLSITTTQSNDFVTNAQAQEVYEQYIPDGICYLPYNDTLSKDDNITNAITKIQNSFSNFIGIRQHNIDIIYKALFTDYDPTLNYDKHMSGDITTEKHKGTRVSESANIITTPNITTTQTETPNTTTTQTETPNTTTTVVETPNTTVNVTGTNTTDNTTTDTGADNKSVFGFDNGNATPSENIAKTNSEVLESVVATENTTETTGTNTIETNDTGTITSTTEINGTNTNRVQETGTKTTSKDSNSNYTDTQDISPYIYDHDIQSYNNYREYGNIGVMTTSSIIEGELALRLKNIAQDLIMEFLNIYCCSMSCADDLDIIE